MVVQIEGKRLVVSARVEMLTNPPSYSFLTFVSLLTVSSFLHASKHRQEGQRCIRDVDEPRYDQSNIWSPGFFSKTPIAFAIPKVVRELMRQIGATTDDQMETRAGREEGCIIQKHLRALGKKV